MSEAVVFSTHVEVFLTFTAGFSEIPGFLHTRGGVSGV